MPNSSIPARVLIVCIIFMACVTAASAETSPDPVIVLKDMATAYTKVDNYTATFVKRERVGGELLPTETIRFKFKKPFMVYMGWQKGPHEGREALYVQGRNDNKVTGHEGGFFGFVTLNMDPNGPTAMRGNRHPITDVGIGRLIDIVTENMDRALSEKALDIRYVGEEDMYGEKARHISVRLPDGRGYYGGLIEIWVDESNGTPIKIEIYGWDGSLWESYGYKDLVINPGIPDAEFSEDYKGYDF